MLEFRTLGDTLYIGLSGELDESNAQSVRSALDGRIDSQNMKRVVFVLNELRFMDSTGIGVLLGRYKKLTERNVSIFVAAPSKSVDKILRISGIYGIMPKIDLKEA